MARLWKTLLRLSFAAGAVVLISALESGSRITSTTLSGGMAHAFAAAAPTRDTKNDIAATARVSHSYGKLPLSFEANEGQTAGVVQYLARGAGYTLFLTPGEMVLSLHASRPGDRIRPGAHSASLPVKSERWSSAVHIQLVGSNKDAKVSGVDRLPGNSNYFSGSDPAKWHPDIPTYAKVRYENVYRGIDLVYYGDQEGRLEHDFVVKPGADPEQISLAIDEKSEPLIEHNGTLRLRRDSGDVHLNPPVVYQTVNGEKKSIAAEYAVGADRRIRFHLGGYDAHYRLVIDPVLVYTALFGGSNDDGLRGLAIDTSGNVFVAGCTSSTDFPLADPFQGFLSPDSAFVSKINASGTALVYSTYLGGGTTCAGSIAVDALGRAYVSGSTYSSDFPVKNAYQAKNAGDSSAFVTVLSPEGNALEWSTYFGGSSNSGAQSAAIDASGNIYVAGNSLYGDIPLLHSYLPKGAGSPWIAKFDRNGVLQYSSIVAGGVNDATLVFAVAVDETGAAYMTGLAALPLITTSPGAFRSTCSNFYYGCGWVGKISPAGDGLVYTTYMGSPGQSHALAVDSDHNAYVGGFCTPGLPVWSSGFQRSFGGGIYDGCVAKFNATGSNLIWSTYLGGSGDDYVWALALDQHRTVYVAGRTCSPNFPLQAPIQGWDTNASPGECQFFLTTLSGSLSSIPYYSTYLGTATPNYGIEEGIGIAVDGLLNVYLGGTSPASNMPPTPGAFSAGSSNGGEKVFVSKLSIVDDLAISVSPSSTSVPSGEAVVYAISVTSKGPDFGVNVRISDTLPADTSLVSINCGGGAFAGGTSTTTSCSLGRLDKGATWTVYFAVVVHAPAGTTLTNTAATISNMQDFVISNNSVTTTTPVE